MKRSLLTGAALSACALVLSFSLAKAQTVSIICMERAKAEEAMTKMVGPLHKRLLGITAGGAALIEIIYDSEGKWFVTINQPNGAACLFANGEAMQDAPPIASGDPA